MDISVNNRASLHNYWFAKRMIHLAGIAFDIGKIWLWGSKMNIREVKLDFFYSK